MFGFPRTLPLFHSQKIWSGQEKRASNIWAVYCMNRAAGHRAVSDFAYRGQASGGSSAAAGSRQASQIGRAHVCEVWNVLVVCGSRGCNSKLTGGSWKQVLETQEVSQRLLEGDSGGLVLILCLLMCLDSRVWVFFPCSGGFDPNLVCYCQRLTKGSVVLTSVWLLLQPLIKKDVLWMLYLNICSLISLPYLFLSQYQTLPLQNEPASSEESFGIPVVREHHFQGRFFGQLVNGQFLAGSREH